MTIITTHSSWVILLAIEIDLHHSFCGALFRMSEERRHVVAAYLSAKLPKDSETKDVGQFLLSAPHHEILSVAYDGDVPRGLRRALGRSGPAIHPEQFYSLLKHLLSSDDSEARKCLAHLPRLDHSKLMTVNALPNSLRTPSLVEALMSENEAGDVVTAFRVLLDNGVDEEWLVRSLREVRTQSALSSVFQRAARRAKAPPHPVPASEFYRPIETGEELFAVAREFRNCLRNYTCAFLDEGQGNAFAMVSRAEHRTVVHLVRGKAGWKLEGLFKSRNRRPSRPTREWIEAYLEEHGVIIERREPRAPTRWDSLHNLICSDLLQFNLDFGFEELDEATETEMI
ncbi:hypothetical protein [Qipengyuania huizhouensis]|uniref:hypothetical protein n=1 Tax=Qipengyuania huizhouensis TaxID=2867245 RepID=UPI001C88DE81|nr:hypothetical protein [Qipengyuania huizhouensis]MBX7459840.1 hypothetical protein [Qipengyuania huizhouensis]